MRILITGGSASGKSAYAEAQAVRLSQESGGKLYYLAAMREEGEEAAGRIARHRALRAGKGFHTVECPVRADQAEFDAAAGTMKPVVLLECLGNLLANEMFENGEENITRRLLAQLDILSEKCGHLLVVTDEVFSDGEPYDAWTRRYIRYLGELNRRLTEAFDAAAELVFGVPAALKGKEMPVPESGGSGLWRAGGFEG